MLRNLSQEHTFKIKVMAFNKTTLKSFLSRCFNAQKPTPEPKLPTSNHSSFQRLSLSDLSNSSFSIVSDLSNSLVGSNLHVFTLKELKAITQNLSASNYLGEGGFGRVYKGFIDDKLRPGLETQPVAVKVLDLEGTQGHREWLVSISNPISIFANIVRCSGKKIFPFLDDENICLCLNESFLFCRLK